MHLSLPLFCLLTASIHAAPSTAQNTTTKLGIYAAPKKVQGTLIQKIANKLANVDVVWMHELNNKPITEWPLVDVFFSWESTDEQYNASKPLAYTQRNKIPAINNIRLQQLLRDRRHVNMLLDLAGIRTPEQMYYNRQDATLSKELVNEIIQQVQSNTTLPLKFRNEILQKTRAELQMCDTKGNCKSNELCNTPEECAVLRIGSRTLKKPFVEKPVDADDHSIRIYHEDGSCTELQRKVGNRCATVIVECMHPRNNESYIYEEYVGAFKQQFSKLRPPAPVDLKIYTLGRDKRLAQARKSPVDGFVERVEGGFENRHEVVLSEEEKKFAELIPTVFGQPFCGFDMLRDTRNVSYVIDVNGYSMVKNNAAYEKAALYAFTEAIHDSVHK